MQLKKISMSILAGLALMAVGCCGPVGPGCHVGGGCTNCDDVGFGRPIAYGPLDGLRQLRKSMVCGAGCGETYFGEWRSTPPDACDPCCDDEWVGGATPCRPFHLGLWRPGAIATTLYGKRFCNDCGEPFDECGCDDCGHGDVLIPSDGVIIQEQSAPTPTPATSGASFHRKSSSTHHCAACEQQARAARVQRVSASTRVSRKPARPGYETTTTIRR